ncbi:hypothetical protein LO772_31770 [Yinghuangia sp. ASG 101]|uniref:hypothetical protein n=1 Tax=Yinghuangia sp. ASG 101 TaxID=2896848 RepID=UPI001E32A93F|nr:hypothetical protein [Yinghuangia sp. ASG 101]UGQ11325.1 hypothetical protein LO772_31770 [Yinghuangia sp. ASG 101]
MIATLTAALDLVDLAAVDNAAGTDEATPSWPRRRGSSAPSKHCAPRSHEVFVLVPSKWGAPYRSILDGAIWETARGRVCRSLGLCSEPGPGPTAVVRRP